MWSSFTFPTALQTRLLWSQTGSQQLDQSFSQQQETASKSSWCQIQLRRCIVKCSTRHSSWFPAFPDMTEYTETNGRLFADDSYYICVIQMPEDCNDLQLDSCKPSEDGGRLAHEFQCHKVQHNPYIRPGTRKLKNPPKCFMIQPITKTYLYNFDHLKPHFYIIKLGFTGVYIIFLFLLKNIDWRYSLEPPRRGGSNEYPQSMFWAEIWKIPEFLYLKTSVFGGEIFDVFE